jgi:hypothetical protein
MVEKFAQFVAENRTAEAGAVLRTKRLSQEVFSLYATTKWLNFNTSSLNINHFLSYSRNLKVVKYMRRLIIDVFDIASDCSWGSIKNATRVIDLGLW